MALKVAEAKFSDPADVRSEGGPKPETWSAQAAKALQAIYNDPPTVKARNQIHNELTEAYQELVQKIDPGCKSEILKKVFNDRLKQLHEEAVAAIEEFQGKKSSSRPPSRSSSTNRKDARKKSDGGSKRKNRT